MYLGPPLLTVVSPVWLRPSKQIRAPLFSTKQKRQRQWIVVKYSIIYLVIVAGLAALIALRKSPHAMPLYCTDANGVCSCAFPGSSKTQLFGVPEYLNILVMFRTF